VLVVGDAMVDITVQLSGVLQAGSDTPGRVSVQPGGSAANAACWLAWQGAHVGFFGFVGDDAAGRDFTESLTRSKVESHLIVVSDLPTGSCVCLVSPGGERTMVPDSGANLAFSSEALSDEVMSRYQHLHLSAYPLLRDETASAVVEILNRARNRGMTISVDPASSSPILEFGPEKLLSELGEIDFIFPDQQEATALTGFLDSSKAANALLPFAQTVVVKLGAAGALGLMREGALVEVATDQVGAIDTTGAGDAFAAGFLDGWFHDCDLSECLAQGVSLAKVCVQQVGGRPKN
jgi:ribokinase